MKFTKRPYYYIRYFLLAAFCFLSGCASIPTIEHPLKIQCSYNASFDKTWDAVLEVVKISKGTIVNQDKAGGLIVYSIAEKKPNPQVYIQIYLKPSGDFQKTLVYLFARDRNSYYAGEIQHEFFQKLEKALKKEK